MIPFSDGFHRVGLDGNEVVDRSSVVKPSGLRVIDGTFTRIEQAMGIPKGRSAGATYVYSFIEEMKVNGFIAEALRVSGQHNAVVALPRRCTGFVCTEARSIS